MKILVCVKRVVDYNVKIRVKADQSGVELANVKMSMNPFDEIAVEEAIRLKEKNIASEVVVLSIGAEGVVETLRAALAMGADRGVHLSTKEAVQPLAAAKLMRTQVEAEQPQMVILGKQAIDDDASQTGQMLAGLLGWPQGTFASKLEVVGQEVTITREVDGGLMRLAMKLPCVMTTDLRLNEPRYASLPNIMKARSKPLATIDAAALGVDLAPRVQIISVQEPPKRKGGGKVESVEMLLDKLKNEAKVL